MKIQGLAVLSIIIILPMSILLNAYSRNQIKTLDLQVQYDSRLKNATYDAISTLKLNESHSDINTVYYSKMRDLKASIELFYTSLSGNFNMSGYGKEVLEKYVPAVVYTLYDGYYIYSAYENTLDKDDSFYNNATYKNGDELYGLKPYIYYSCRYKKGSSYDIVITYSLDSYITIQGTINGEPVNESGYLLTGVGKSASGTYTYRGVEILTEEDKDGLKQNVYVEGSIISLPCKKINGVNYYYESRSNTSFTTIGNTLRKQSDVKNITKNKMGIEYYKQAYEFRKKFESGGILESIIDLNASDAVDSNGKKYTGEQNPYTDYKIFEGLLTPSGGVYIEDSNSNFNAHKVQVIKNVIETNLSTAIANYNKVTNEDVSFSMPKLKEYEWEELTHTPAVMTFLQGLNIGGKIYNGYAVVPNNHSEEYVSEDYIYILNNGEYHRVTDSDLLADNSNAIGILNTDFDVKSLLVKKGDDEGIIYYASKDEEGCYNSIINANSGVSKATSIYEYLSKDLTINLRKYHLAQVYYTALGRERWGMRRIANSEEYIKQLKAGE